LIDQPREIRQPDVLRGQTEIGQQVDAGQRRGARATHHQLHVPKFLAHDFQAVEHCRGNDNGRAMLIVVEYRDLHARAKLALDLEALRRLDVLEIDSAEGGFQCRDDLHQLVGIAFVDLDVEHVEVGEFLEQNCLAFHHRLGRQRPDGAESEHRGAVGDDADEISARGVTQGREWIRHDLFAGSSHAR
jgi:hypothetical protein